MDNRVRCFIAPERRKISGAPGSWDRGVSSKLQFAAVADIFPGLTGSPLQPFLFNSRSSQTF